MQKRPFVRLVHMRLKPLIVVDSQESIVVSRMSIIH